jgi:hypothetical protein
MMLSKGTTAAATNDVPYSAEIWDAASSFLTLYIYCDFPNWLNISFQILRRKSVVRENFPNFLCEREGVLHVIQQKSLRITLPNLK